MPSRLSKIVGADENRPTRLHTQSGQALPARCLPLVGLQIARRIVRRPSFEPWMVHDAVRSLQGQMCASDTVLELGSGRSTAWFGERSSKVVSVEPDDLWGAKVRSDLTELALHNCTILGGPIRCRVDELVRSAGFDVVIVDFTDEVGFDRADAIMLIASGERAPRVIVLDDSDRPGYQSAFSIPGYEYTRFVGMKQRPLRATETTIFVRRRG